MTHRKDVVKFNDIMENLDEIPKGDPFARGRGPADPLRERAMADALAAPQLAERVRELEAERDGYARSHLILKGIHGALTDTIPSTPIPPLDSFAVVDLVRVLATESKRLHSFEAQSFSQMIRQEAQQMRAYGLSYEGVRKVLHEYNDGEISFGKLMDLLRAAARAMAEDMKK